jgi:hypothetical protein
MKLQTKQREGSKLRRTYDEAQTPMQRLLVSGALPANKQQELLRITQALDPLRLLQQLEHLQKALWRHAVMPEAASSPEPSSTLQFSVNQVARDQVPADGIAGVPPSLLKQKRRRRYQKSGRPHDWRTRQDPFEGVWEEITRLSGCQTGTHRSRDLPRVGTPLPRTLSTHSSSNFTARRSKAAGASAGDL